MVLCPPVHLPGAEALDQRGALVGQKMTERERAKVHVYMHCTLLYRYTLERWVLHFRKMEPSDKCCFETWFLSIAEVPRIIFFLINEDSVTSFIGCIEGVLR